MLKSMICAAVAAGFVTVAALSVQAGTMVPSGTSCKEAAKMAFPDDRKMRHHYKKSCKHNFKHAQKS
ncbi:MAG: hypothetical protein WD852_00415 [Methyloceanibacter sp.]